MSIEQHFLNSKQGRDVASRFTDFLDTLVIKMNPDADAYEDKEMCIAWEDYKRAMEGTDDIFMYSYGLSELKLSGLYTNTQITNLNLINPNIMHDLIMKNNTRAIQFIGFLRKRLIDNYVERNAYYKQFQGIPIDESQYIRIENLDRKRQIANVEKWEDLKEFFTESWETKNPAPDPDLYEELYYEWLEIRERVIHNWTVLFVKPILGDEYIYLHEVTRKDFPLLYQKYVLDHGIEDILVTRPDMVYLRFLNTANRVSYYLARKADQFTLLYCNKTLLTDEELNRFKVSYDKTRIYIEQINYIDGFEGRMPMYPYMEELLLLHGTVYEFFNTYMENWALANYSDNDIFNILDSYNLSELKKVSIKTLRKIIRYLPGLLELKGSEDIIIKILDIVADKSISVKRYYIQKIYNVNAINNVSFKLDKPYENSVDIVFRPKIIQLGAGEDETTIVDNRAYDSFVENDDTWGGDLSGLSSGEAAKVKAAFKRELLGIDFSTILTKYLTISKIISVNEKQIKASNLFALLIQCFDKYPELNFLKNERVKFREIEATPFELYVALTLMSGIYHQLEYYDDIDAYKHLNLSRLMILRESDNLQTTINDIKEKELDFIMLDHKGDEITEKKKIKDILGDNFPYSDYLISFNETTDIEAILNSYDDNRYIISKINDKIKESTTIPEYRAWRYILYEQNNVNQQYADLFDGYDKFSDYLKDNNMNLWLEIEDSIYNYPYKTGEFLDNFIEVNRVFSAYINEKTNGRIELSNEETNSSDMAYMNDLYIMFNEFMSIYTTLYSLEFTYVLSDHPFNRIQMLDQFRDMQVTDYKEAFRLMKWETLDELMFDNYITNCNLRYYFASIVIYTNYTIYWDFVYKKLLTEYFDKYLSEILPDDLVINETHYDKRGQEILFIDSLLESIKQDKEFDQIVQSYAQLDSGIYNKANDHIKANYDQVFSYKYNKAYDELYLDEEVAKTVYDTDSAYLISRDKTAITGIYLKEYFDRYVYKLSPKELYIGDITYENIEKRFTLTGKLLSLLSDANIVRKLEFIYKKLGIYHSDHDAYKINIKDISISDRIDEYDEGKLGFVHQLLNLGSDNTEKEDNMPIFIYRLLGIDEFVKYFTDIIVKYSQIDSVIYTKNENKMVILDHIMSTIGINKYKDNIVMNYLFQKTFLSDGYNNKIVINYENLDYYSFFKDNLRYKFELVGGTNDNSYEESIEFKEFAKETYFNSNYRSKLGIYDEVVSDIVYGMEEENDGFIIEGPPPKN
jgi:hypothetical protein